MEFKFVSPERETKCTWKPNATNSPHNGEYNKTMNWKTIMPNILSATGQTPMVKLNHIPKKYGIKCEILAKCEFMNPGGSLKDRIAIKMIETAENKGLLKPGYTIIEPSSGNTGVGVAMVSAVKGYQCIIVISEEYSDEKLYTMKALGAKIVRTPMEAAWNSPEGPMATAQKMQKQIPNSLILDQYTNPENPLTHYNETATEIWEQCGGKVDYIVGGLGTGGIISGIGRKFRELSPSTKIVVADPRKPLADKFFDARDRMHNVEGIGHNYVTVITDLDVVDVQIKTTEKECFRLARELIKEEGFLCGGSSGASLSAALTIAKGLPADKRVVILLNDTIRNYLTKFVSDSWMETKGLLDQPTPLTSNEWWWNLSVTDLPLIKPVLLSSDITCEKAVEFLQKKNLHQVAISDDKGNVKGFITLDKLLSGLISGELNDTDLATKVLAKQYKKVPKTTTLGRLSRILLYTLYAVVFDENNDGSVIGISTQSDLFNFIKRRK